MDIGDYLKEDVDVVEVSLGDATNVGVSTIKIDRSYYKLISEDREIGLALAKRFKGKTTLYGIPDFKDLVSMCLSTDGYKVCSNCLVNVSDEDVASAWQFIDTISVSSTERCRNLVSKGKGGRTGMGFLRSPMRNVRSPRASRYPHRSRLGVNLGGPPVVAPPGENVALEHNTMEEAIAEDCAHWVISSPDPIESFRQLRLNLSDRHEGV